MKFAPLIAVPLVIAALAGCSAPSSAPTQVHDRLTDPKYGGTVKILVDYDLNNLDPSGPLKNVMGNLVPMVYNTLIGTDVGPNVEWSDHKLVPELAERWAVSPDAKTYTFHLRKGAKFANIAPVNGREVSSQDVAVSFEYWNRSGRFADKKLPASRSNFLFAGLDRVDTPDPYTAVIRFTEPSAPFLTYASDHYSAIVPKELFDAPGGLPDWAIGSGPFQMDKAATISGSRQVYKKNPDYWKSGQPYLDEVHHLILSGDASKEAAFVTRQLDVLDPGSDNGAQNIKKSHPQGKYIESVGSSFVNIFINSRVAPLNDIRIRRALSLGINRDELIKTLFAGKGDWALAAAPRGLFTQEETRQILKYDPEAAKRLVAEAGFPNGVDVEWLYSGPEDGDLYESRVQLMQAQLKKSNINLQLKVTSTEERNRKRRTPDGHQLTGTGGGATSADMGFLLEEKYASGATGNYGGVADPKLDALIKAQRAEADPAKRRELVRQAVRYLNGEMVWGLGITYEPQFLFWQPDLMNFHPSVWQNAPGTPLENVWR